MNTTKAVKDALAGDAGIVAALDVWAGLPAIFNDQAPDPYLMQQTKFCIVIEAPSRDRGDETFTEDGRAIEQDVRFYAVSKGSTLALDDLARAARDLFHDNPSILAVDGGITNFLRATGPTNSPTSDPSLIGRRISLTIEIERI